MQWGRRTICCTCNEKLGDLVQNMGAEAPENVKNFVFTVVSLPPTADSRCVRGMRAMNDHNHHTSQSQEGKRGKTWEQHGRLTSNKKHFTLFLCKKLAAAHPATPPPITATRGR